MTEVNGPLVTIMHPGWPRAVTGNPPAGTTGNIAIAVSPPANPQPGWLWWSTIDGQLYVFTGCEWVAASCCEPGITVAPDPPTFPSTGVLWWNTNDGQLYVWDGSEWVAASCCGPQTITSIRSTVPENPNTGDLWWNNNDGQLYVWIGSAWVPASCCGGLPEIPPNTVLGNISTGQSEPAPLTKPQLTSLINPFTQTLNGSVPAPGLATPPTDILQADGTWVNPGGLAPIPNDTVLGNISGTTAVPGPLTPAALTPLINLFTATRSGTVPATGSITNLAPTDYFLDSSGHWTVPGSNLRSVTASYTTATTDDAVYVSAVASPTITLPALSSVPTGKQIRIISQATTSLIIAQTGADSIFTLTDSGWISSAAALTLTPPANELLFLAVGTVGWFMVNDGEPLFVNNGTSTITAVGKVDTSGLASTDVFTQTTDGLVPAPGAATPAAYVLSADGSWNQPGLPTLPANTVLGNPTAASAVAVAVNQTQLTALVNVFTQTLNGAVPAPTTAATISQYLRSDGTWQMPGTNFAMGSGDPWAPPATADVMLVTDVSNVQMPAPTPDGRVIRVISSANGEVSFTTSTSGNLPFVLLGPSGWVHAGPDFWTGLSNIMPITELLFVAGDGVWWVFNEGAPTIASNFPNGPVTLIGKAPGKAVVRTTTGTYTAQPNDDYVFYNLTSNVPSGIALPAPSACPVGKIIRVTVNANPAPSPFLINSGGTLMVMTGVSTWALQGASYAISGLNAGQLAFINSGVNWYLINQGPILNSSNGNAVGGVLPQANIVTFTASGTYSQSPGTRYAIIECIGGGGGGGGATGNASFISIGGGGGAGGYSRSIIAGGVGLSNITVTIGAGGAASGSTTNGSNTSFGTAVIANGGSGGITSNGTTGGGAGNGGTLGTGQVRFVGNDGYFGKISPISSTTSWVSGGRGGGGTYGGEVYTGANTAGGQAAGTNARANTGSGGCGGWAAAGTTGTVNGGAGGSGICIITEYIF